MANRQRCTRTIVYEGPEDWLAGQLQKSWSTGMHPIGAEATITITQHGPVPVVTELATPAPVKEETRG